MEPLAIDPAELDAYDAWVADHLDEMVRLYPGKVIGVHADELIAVADTYREVFDAAAKRGIGMELLTLRVPSLDEAVVVPSAFPEGA